MGLRLAVTRIKDEDLLNVFITVKDILKKAQFDRNHPDLQPEVLADGFDHYHQRTDHYSDCVSESRKRIIEEVATSLLKEVRILRGMEKRKH
ncbi:hypothetical protein HYX12_01700 [Candidatus Woesearchaeota archaeon]|nr:hypothetical protein [Candidatus Woesearchaeota archaeon]